MSESIYRKYQEVPLVPVYIHKNVFRYVEHKTTSSCPVCDKKPEDIWFTQAAIEAEETKFFQKRLCTVFSRLILAGHWWWKKPCPLVGIHWHCLCPQCSCVWIVRKTDNDDLLKQVELIS